MEHGIEIKKLTKSFKDNVVLNEIDLFFDAQKIHGIIGRNGSGKTVLMKCITGLMTPTSGEILIDGVSADKVNHQDMGVIIETPGFIDSQSAYTNLKYLAKINNLISKEDIIKTLKLVGLEPNNKKHVGKYSLGMKQRLGIAQAIMENPDILILDEPMNGLDNQGVQDIRNLLLDLKEQGETIILASHNKEDISLLCDTVIELDNGVIVSQNNLNN